MGQQVKMVQPEKRNVAMNPPWAWCPECWVQTERDEKTGECLQCKKRKEQNINLMNLQS
jgi:hypothetical protein